MSAGYKSKPTGTSVEVRTNDNTDEFTTDRYRFTLERRPTMNPRRPQWFACCRTLSGSYLIAEVRCPSRAKAAKRIAEWANNMRHIESRP